MFPNPITLYYNGNNQNARLVVDQQLIEYGRQNENFLEINRLLVTYPNNGVIPIKYILVFKTVQGWWPLDGRRVRKKFRTFLLTHPNIRMPNNRGVPPDVSIPWHTVQSSSSQFYYTFHPGHDDEFFATYRLALMAWFRYALDHNFNGNDCYHQNNHRVKFAIQIFKPLDPGVSDVNLQDWLV